MNARRALTLILAATLALALQASVASAKPTSSCTDPAGCIVLAPGEPIRLGTFVVTERGAIGRESAQAVELAVEQRGSVAGHPIQLIHVGDGCQADLATTTAEAVAADRVLAGVIGPACSNVSRVVAPILGGAGITMISPSSTTPVLTDPALRDPFFFRTVYNDLFHADELASFLGGAGTRAAIVADSSISFSTVGDRFADQFALLGGTTTKYVVSPDQDDFSTELTAIAASDPDAIVFLTFQSAAFVTQARATPGLEATTLATIHGPADSLLAIPEAEGVVLAAPDFSFLESEPYASTLGGPFADTFGEPPTLPYHAYAFDAASLLMDVIGSFQQGNSQRLTIPRTALRDAIAATTGYAGVSGSITCGPSGDCNAQVFVMRAIQGGVIVDL